MHKVIVTWATRFPPPLANPAYMVEHPGQAPVTATVEEVRELTRTKLVAWSPDGRV